MRNLLTVILIFLCISCKEKGKKQNKINNIKPIDTIVNVIEKPIVSNIEFLNYIDESLIFQEKYGNDFVSYAFVCDGTKDTINFSGTIYLMPSKKDYKNWSTSNYREKIIDSINNFFSNNKIHSRYNLLAQITHKENFLPLEEWVDNPCEFYKENRTMNIYFSEAGNQNWNMIKETKNEDEIERIIKVKIKKRIK